MIESRRRSQQFRYELVGTTEHSREFVPASSPSTHEWAWYKAVGYSVEGMPHRYL